MDVGGYDRPQYAQVGTAIVAASVWIEGNDQNPTSLDMWWQPNGSRLIECLDEHGGYNSTLLPIG